MGGEWPKAQIADVAENLDARRVPLAGRERSSRHGTYPYYGPTGILDYIDGFIFDGLHVLIAEDGSVERPDGTVFRQLINGKFWVNNHAHILRGSSDDDTKYIYYALSIVPIRPFISGSVQDKLTQRSLNAISISFPDRPTRHRIGALFGALDDKIELNRRMAETLEAMARALFKSWFVDFDPVRAKAEGRSTGLPDDTAALFPDAFADDGVPVGWAAIVGDIAELVRSTVEPSQIDPSTCYLGLEHLPRRSLVVTEGGAAADVDSLKTQFRAGDLLFGKLRPYFHKVVIAPQDGICSSDIFVFRPAKGVPPSFLYLSFSEDQFVQQASNASSGTRMPRADWTYMKKLPTIQPTRAVLAAFDRVASPFISAMLAKARQSRTLADLRDTLLPKLISGELRIADAEHTVSAA